MTFISKNRFILGILTVSTLLFSNIAYADNTSTQTFNLKITEPELIVTISDPGLAAVTELPRNDVAGLHFFKKIDINNGGNVDFNLNVKLAEPPSGIKYGVFKAQPGYMRVEVASQQTLETISDNPDKATFLQKIKAKDKLTSYHEFTIAPGTPVGTYPVKINYIVSLATS